MCIPNNTSHNFPSQLLRFWTLWCTYTRFNPLFWPFTWFQSIVVDLCFIHRHNLTQKLFRITVKTFQILLQRDHTNLAQSFLMHKCVCIILSTRSVEMDTISRTSSFGSFRKISWILLIISGVVILFGRPGFGMVSLLLWLQRNSANTSEPFHMTQ